MYIPPHFEEKRIEVLHALVQAHAFGTLVTLGPEGLDANHLPFELDPATGPFGTLRAHVARSNPGWRDRSGGMDALAMFQGSHAYITPSWYATKRDSGKVVPTYNYLAVHAYGPMRVIDDPAWLRGLVQRLTDRHEAARPDPWRVADAPDEYIDAMVGAIVGIEIPIVRLLGKWKVSQNRSDADRAGVVEGLRQAGDGNSVAMAETVQQSTLLKT